MATQREEIIVRAGFDSTALASGLRQANHQIKDFAKEIGRDLLAAFSAGAFIAKIDTVFSRVKSIQSGAAKTGFKAEDYQKLSQIAAEDLPDGAEKFDQAMTRLNVKIGQGAKELEKWGIHSRNAQDAMFEIADKMREIEDPAERAAMAVDLMGRSGANMVPFLERGAAALKQMEGSKWGLSAEEMKQIEDAHKNIERANNNFTIAIGKAIGFYMTVVENIAGEHSGASLINNSRASPLLAQRAVEQRHQAEILKAFADAELQTTYEQYAAEMELLDAQIESADAAKAKAKYDKESYEFNKKAADIHRKMNDIDRESPIIADLAGRGYTNGLNKSYGAGGRFDLGAGNGPFGAAAREYLLAQKQQLYDLTYGNTAAAAADRRRMIAAHNLLAGAGLETPAMQMAELSRNMAELVRLANAEGIAIKDSK